MFPPRATSEPAIPPCWISFSLWRLARHLASHDPHLLCPAHCPARPLKSPRLFLLASSPSPSSPSSPSSSRPAAFREGGRLEERKDSSDLRGMARDALNADLSPFHLYRSHSAFRIPSHFRARSHFCIILRASETRDVEKSIKQIVLEIFFSRIFFPEKFFNLYGYFIIFIQYEEIKNDTYQGKV